MDSCGEPTPAILLNQHHSSKHFKYLCLYPEINVTVMLHQRCLCLPLMETITENIKKKYKEQWTMSYWGTSDTSVTCRHWRLGNISEERGEGKGTEDQKVCCEMVSSRYLDKKKPWNFNKTPAERKIWMTKTPIDIAVWIGESHSPSIHEELQTL